MNKKLPYTYMDHVNMIQDVSNTYSSLMNRGLVMHPTLTRLDQSHKALGDLKQMTNPSTFIAQNTLPQSNPYSPNQVRRKK